MLTLLILTHSLCFKLVMTLLMLTLPWHLHAPDGTFSGTFGAGTVLMVVQVSFDTPVLLNCIDAGIFVIGTYLVLADFLLAQYWRCHTFLRLAAAGRLVSKTLFYTDCSWQSWSWHSWCWHSWVWAVCSWVCVHCVEIEACPKHTTLITPGTSSPATDSSDMTCVNRLQGIDHALQACTGHYGLFLALTCVTCSMVATDSLPLCSVIALHWHWLEAGVATLHLLFYIVQTWLKLLWSALTVALWEFKVDQQNPL